MPDKNSILENQQELKFSGEQGFFDKSQTIRAFIILLFAAVLFCFLHFREVQVETLELKSIAPGYIVTQVDFDFNDDEATLILRQNALKDIGKIYIISQKDIVLKRNAFEDYLLSNPSWHEMASSTSFDEIYRGTNTIEKALMQLRLTDSRTLEKLKDQNFPTKNYHIFIPSQANDPITLPNYIWDEIQKEYFPSDSYTPAISAIIINYFKQAQWHFEEDIPIQKQLRKSIQEAIPEKTSHVSAGNRLIDQGEKVTTRHIAMLQAMKQALGESRHLSQPWTLAGTLLLTGILVGIVLAYLKNVQPKLLQSNRKLFLLITVLSLTLGISKLMELFLLNSTSGLIDLFRYPLFIPLGAILLASLINTTLAIFSSGFLSIITAIALTFEWEGLLILNLCSSLVAIFSTHSLCKRKEIFLICFKAWACCVALILALHLYNNNTWNWSILADVFSASFFMILTAVLVIGFLPLLESTFSVMTDVSLMEYMDPNNELLKRLSIEAPGTYQHSLVVGHLSETAALAIGANGLFCRVSSLYHDVGKMVTSQYFTENQLEEVNIHQLLTPQESAQVIMAHVSEGVAMCREAGLPEPVIDIVKEHHGTTLVYYFYCKQLEKSGGDKTQVDEKEFRYSGPKPHIKESGIIMITDSFEAASRSLDVMNEETLTELVNRLVQEKIEDGQLDNCLLTFEELSIVKQTLVKTLLAAGHSRIKYPKHKKKNIYGYDEENA